MQVDSEAVEEQKESGRDALLHAHQPPNADGLKSPQQPADGQTQRAKLRQPAPSWNSADAVLLCAAHRCV